MSGGAPPSAAVPLAAELVDRRRRRLRRSTRDLRPEICCPTASARVRKHRDISYDVGHYGQMG